MKNPKEIGEILKGARQKKGLTIDEVYNKTRIQPKTIAVIEDGTYGETMGSVYAFLFLKKYALFLGLDTEDLLASYKNFYRDKEKVVLDIEKEPQPINIELRKWMIPAVSLVLVFMVVFFILFLGFKLKSFYSTRKTAKAEVPSVISKPALFPIVRDKPIELSLRSTDSVWMKVKKDGKSAFEGTLRKGKRKSWSADDKIELWIGRAEALDFTINGKSIGSIGKGSIKNIQISRRGLKIKNKWLLKAKE